MKHAFVSDDGTFNPGRKVCGFYPPDRVARERTFINKGATRPFTDGMKRLYERAVRWSGMAGTFWRGFDSMAEELGKSGRQVKSDMAALEAAGLIAHTRRGNRQTNVYRFLWHPMFDSDVQSTALQKQNNATAVRCGSESSEVQDSVKSEVQPTALELCTESNCESLKLTTADELPKTGNTPAGASVPSHGYAVKTSQEAQDLKPLVNLLSSYMEGDMPPEGFSESCMLSAGGRSVAEVCAFLEAKYRRKKNRPGGRHGPRRWTWFLSVIRNEFSVAEHGRSPELVAAPYTMATAEELEHGIEALELPDAEKAPC